MDDYNLSQECLTSPQTRSALRKYLLADDTLRNEIQNRTGKPIFTDEELEAETEKQDLDDQDDTSVPIEAIIQEEFGVKINGLPGIDSTYCHKASDVTTFDDTDCSGLTASTAEEDIWSFDDKGNLWGTIKAK